MKILVVDTSYWQGGARGVQCGCVVPDVYWRGEPPIQVVELRFSEYLDEKGYGYRVGEGKCSRCGTMYLGCNLADAINGFGLGADLLGRLWIMKHLPQFDYNTPLSVVADHFEEKGDAEKAKMFRELREERV